MEMMSARAIFAVLTGQVEILGPSPPELIAVRQFFDLHGRPDPFTLDDVERALEIVGK